MNTISIYIVDDHAIMREGLRHILSDVPEFEIAGEAGDGETALREIERTRPNVVILDLSMPGMPGFEVVRRLKETGSESKIIILSRHDREEYINEALRHGIAGYVLKENAGEDLVSAIHEVMKGNAYLSPRVAAMVVSDYHKSRRQATRGVQAADLRPLSAREKEVLKLVAGGKSNEEIANHFGLSINTIKVHRYNIMQKLNMHNTAELVQYAVKAGFIDL